MTCAEFKELAALYALGSLDPEERAAAEAHLLEPHHEGCFEALRQASAGVTALARSLPAVRPDERVWRGIEARIAPAPRGRRERIAWAVAAAAVLLLLFGLRAQERRVDTFAAEGRRQAEALAAAAREKQECLGQLSSLRGEAEAQKAAIALLQSPSTLLVQLQPQPKGAGLGARALVDLAAHKAMLLSGALAPRPGKDFELWIIRGKEAPVPAGLLRAGPSGAVLASIDRPLLAADTLAVSVEPQGGSPTGLPTGDVVLVGTLPKS